VPKIIIEGFLFADVKSPDMDIVYLNDQSKECN